MRALLALLLAMFVGAAHAQVTPGTSPLSGPKGGTNNAFMQFTGPASTLKTYTLPNSSDTIATLAAIQTWTGAKSFTDGTLVLLGSSSGTSTLKAPATGGGVATLFPGSDTIAGLAATQTLTNKTFNCANNTCTVRIASDVTGLATGAATFLTTPSSANLRALLTDESGTGAALFAGGALGAATATSINGVTITAGTGTLALSTFTESLGGNLTTAAAVSFPGAFSTTITATATTNSTLPAGTHTLSAPDVAETISAVKTFQTGDLALSGSTSGTSLLNAPATGGGTATLFPGSDTVAGLVATQTLTNKTINCSNNTCSNYPNATNVVKGVMEGDGSTISCVAGVCSSVGSAATAVTLLSTIATGGTAGDNVSITSTGCSSTTPCLTQFSPAPITNSLGADVALNNTANYFDGPSIAQGTSGTWFASGTVTLNDTATAVFACKLWDGTTIVASAEAVSLSTQAVSSISLSGAITSPAGNIRISCKDSSTTGKIIFNLTGNSKDSTITAHRIQ